MASTVWKGQLSFGLVSVPVRIIRAGRQERVNFRKVYRTSQREEEPAESAPAKTSKMSGAIEEQAPASYSDIPVAPVRHEYATQGGEERIPEREVLKAVEYEKGEFAVFRPDEVKKFNIETSSEMEILQFVPTDSIDPVYFNASYYVLPDKGGEKPYSLLYEAMSKSAHSAVAYVAMHGRKQLLTLRAGFSGIVMHTLFFENEVHRAEEFKADASLVRPQELKLAELLVSQLKAEFEPSQYKDERLERMRESVAEKIGNRQVSHATAEPPERKPVIDIMDALRKSLEKKPAARESREARPKRRKTAGA